MRIDDTDFVPTMNKAAVSIRELRKDFRSVERKLKAHGQIVITDNGIPRFLLRALPPTPVKDRTKDDD